MLRYFPVSDENHGNVPAVAVLQESIGINIHFAEDSAEFQHQRRNGSLGFVAEVASGAGVESDVTRAGNGKSGVFGMRAHRFSAK